MCTFVSANGYPPYGTPPDYPHAYPSQRIPAAPHSWAGPPVRAETLIEAVITADQLETALTQT